MVKAYAPNLEAYRKIDGEGVAKKQEIQMLTLAYMWDFKSSVDKSVPFSTA